MIAFLFPGQGTQKPGMGRQMWGQYGSARAAFREASEILGRDVEKLCFSTDMETLTRTENAQVAISAVNMVALRVLAEIGVAAEVVAGHSVGELAALFASGAISAEAFLRLAVFRGEVMSQVRTAGAMYSVIGLSSSELQAVCNGATPGPVVIGLENAPDMLVISGERSATKRCAERAIELGAKRVSQLQVGQAFHSPLMKGAQRIWSQELERTIVSTPALPIVLNVSARATTDITEIRAGVVKQLTSTVKWKDCMRTLAEMGVSIGIEAGASKTLGHFARRSMPDAKMYSLESATQHRELASLVAQVV